MKCSNPYCRDGVCHGPRSPVPHACKACKALRERVIASALRDGGVELQIVRGWDVWLDSKMVA